MVTTALLWLSTLCSVLVPPPASFASKLVEFMTKGLEDVESSGTLANESSKALSAGGLLCGLGLSLTIIGASRTDRYWNANHLAIVPRIVSQSSAAIF